MIDNKVISHIKDEVSKLDRSNFDDRCSIARLTAISDDMSYDERLLMQKIRYGC